MHKIRIVLPKKKNHNYKKCPNALIQFGWYLCGIACRDSKRLAGLFRQAGDTSLKHIRRSWH